ncbi:hypothetical protein GLW00_05590 [Halobacillus litoralis]|uniref:Uncharacterized protein n=1 Tax=Halobacillus litoralis TaxID=45668 RepID=A0A845F8P7_9BACI|nr:hypothetical protein [Halobacillus litoralis]MYL70310.1 hypothetical protein [Halobacillus litoralis]
MRKSFCHCFSNKEEIDQGIKDQVTYLAFCVVSGEHGAVEFSFRTSYIDRDSAAPFMKFYDVCEELEEDNKMSRRIRVHSKNPLAQGDAEPTEKSFLRSPERFYSYKIGLDLDKLQSFEDNPNKYLRTIHSKKLYDEMKAVYKSIFKYPPDALKDDHWVVLID